MKGDAEIIEALNDCLTAELTVINQYFAHSMMCKNWGYEKLASKFREESIEEMKHAESLIDRILFLEGIPNMQRLGPVKVGETVPEQLKFGLEMEVSAQERLNRYIGLCRDKTDNGTRELLETILAEEEHSLDWFEAQHDLIKQVGIENYLSQQMFP